MEFKSIGIAGAGMSRIFAEYGCCVTVYDDFEAAVEKSLVKLNQAAALS